MRAHYFTASNTETKKNKHKEERKVNEYIYQDEDDWSDTKKKTVAFESDEGMGEYVLRCIESKTGKWVRYDENGMMMKGWVTIEGKLAELYPKQVGNTYYYDYQTGLMAKGKLTIDGFSRKTFPPIP